MSVENERKKIVTSVLNEWNLLSYDKKEFYIEQAQKYLESQWEGDSTDFMGAVKRDSPQHSGIEIESLAMELFSFNINKHIMERLQDEGGIWGL